MQAFSLSKKEYLHEHLLYENALTALNGLKKRKTSEEKCSFHRHTASFFRFMATNLSLTQLVTLVKLLWWV